MRAVRVSDAATTSIVSFAVVVTIYAVAFGAFMTVLQAPQGVQRDAPQLEARATGSLLDALASPGQTRHNAVGWNKDTDNLTRFGLALPGKPGQLDVDKLRNLTRGSIAKDTANNLLDYEEARDALGLQDYDFHLRTYPIFNSLDEAGSQPVKGLDVAYVGDFEEQNGGGPNNYPVQYASFKVVENKWVNVSVNITNNGTVATVFQIEATVYLDDGNLIDTANTPLLYPGGWYNATLRVYKTSSWEWAGSDKNVTIKISDVSKKVAEFKVELPSEMDSPSYGPYAAVTASPGALTYKSDKKVRVYYDVWDGQGETVKNVAINVSVRNSANALVRWWEGDTSNSGKVDFDPLPEGFYNITVRRTSDSAFNSTDTIQVIDTSVGEFTSSGGATNRVESAAAKSERAMLVRLVEGFVNRTFDDSSGHVYPDLKKTMNGDLADNLTAKKFEVLVVGSNVDHNAMTSNAAKDAVKQWVLDGGLLLVLGSQDQNVNWLQPLFKAKLTTSGNGIGVPDENHPILHTPEELNWRTYLDNGRAWEFNQEDDASGFTHVIIREGGNKPQDVLAVSKPGHFGNGSIVLTSWTLFAITSPQVDNESEKTFYNFLTFAWGSLYVDFGPRIPDRVEVASSSRMATAPSPVDPSERVLVRVVLYVFK